MVIEKSKILVAPCSYKGSLSSIDIAKAIKTGIEKANPQVDIKCLPLADGGDGTIDSIKACLGGEVHLTEVIGPLNNREQASWLVVDNWILIELANCCGMATIVNEAAQPTKAHTYGLGQVIRACLELPHKRIFIGLGGSASTDGGTGALTALGVKFLDASKKILPLGGEYLSELESIDLSGLDKRLEHKEIQILADVRCPLLGENGAAAKFAPQKGANSEEVCLLENGLTRLAAVIIKTTKDNLIEFPGSGAAGGAAFGLASLLKAKVIPGFAKIAQLIGLQEKIKNCDLVITAEGRLDSQSFNGKAVGELAYLCKNLAKPLIIFPASIEDEISFEEFGMSGVYPITDGTKMAGYADIIETVEKEWMTANIVDR